MQHLWPERLKEAEFSRQNSLSTYSAVKANLCSENKESLQCLSALFSDCPHVGGSGSLGRPFWLVSQLYFHQCILKKWFHVSPGPDSGGGEPLIIPVLSIPKLCIFNWFFCLYDLVWSPAPMLSAEKSLPFPPHHAWHWENLQGGSCLPAPTCVWFPQTKGSKTAVICCGYIFVVNKAKCHLPSLPWANRHFRARAFKA